MHRPGETVRPRPGSEQAACQLRLAHRVWPGPFGQRGLWTLQAGRSWAVGTAVELRFRDPLATPWAVQGERYRQVAES